MLYINKFHFVDSSTEDQFTTTLKETYHSTIYPFGILYKKDITSIEFDPITIFYGGNGCGKTTALNIIAEKAKLKRDSLYNRSEFFEKYINLCKLEAKIPFNSRIITSDDVFDYNINIRHFNQNIDMHRDDLLKECIENKYNYNNFKLKSLDDYETLKTLVSARKNTISKQIRQNSISSVREYSNGESAFLYFTQKIQNDAVYLLDEPENSLSPEKQLELRKFLQDSVRFYNCQFVIATHSPFLLSIKDAKIYDFDEIPVKEKKWTELKNVRDYYNFFKSHESEF